MSSCPTKWDHLSLLTVHICGSIHALRSMASLWDSGIGRCGCDLLGVYYRAVRIEAPVGFLPVPENPHSLLYSRLSQCLFQ